MVLVARMLPAEPQSPPPRSQYYWLSVSSHLLYFYYAHHVSPVVASAVPAEAAVALAAALANNLGECIARTAQACAAVRVYALWLALTVDISLSVRRPFRA